MKQVACFIIIVVGIFLMNGCQESDSALVNRARLVGNENLQLKEQLAEKETEIQALKDEIARLEAEKEKTHEDFGNTTIKTLKMVSESQQKIEELTAENQKLKEQIEQLQGE